MRSRLPNRIGLTTPPLKVITDPAHAFTIASRRLPAPESEFVVTVGLVTHETLLTLKLRLPVVLTVYALAMLFAINAGDVATPLPSVFTVTVFVEVLANTPLAPAAGAVKVTA